MQITLTDNYEQNVRLMRKALRVSESFDVLEKTLRVDKGELTLFFIDGFAKDTAMQKLLMHFISVKRVSESARDYMIKNLPYIETDVTDSVEGMISAVLSGCTLMLGSSFGAEAIIIDIPLSISSSTNYFNTGSSNIIIIFVSLCIIKHVGKNCITGYIVYIRVMIREVFNGMISIRFEVHRINERIITDGNCYVISDKTARCNCFITLNIKC